MIGCGTTLIRLSIKCSNFINKNKNSKMDKLIECLNLLSDFLISDCKNLRKNSSISFMDVLNQIKNVHLVCACFKE